MKRGSRKNAQRQHRRRDAALPARRTAAPSTERRGEAAEHDRVGPAARRGLDDRVDERDQRGDRQAGADEVERARLRVAALGHEPHGRRRSATPTIGTLSQNTALQENHSSSRPPTNGPRPMPTPAIADQMPIALRALLAREDVHDHRERRGHDHRAADAHRGAQRDQLPGVSAPARRARSRCRRATSPACRARLRPKRSPSVPIVSSTPAKASR